MLIPPQTETVGAVALPLAVEMGVAYDAYLLLMEQNCVAVPLTRIEFYREYILNKTLNG